MHMKQFHAMMMCQSKLKPNLLSIHSRVIDLLARCQEIGSRFRHWIGRSPRHVAVLPHQRLLVLVPAHSRWNSLLQNLQDHHVSRSEDLRGTSIQVSF
jgi:hypothetical protein